MNLKNKIDESWLNENQKYSCPYCKKEYSKKGICTHIWRKHEDGINFNPIKNCKKRKPREKIFKEPKTLTDEQKLLKKYGAKKFNAKKEGLSFELTFEEFKQLVFEANITHEDMRINGYHLARYNDCGGYSVGNCRFLFYLDNYKERKVSDKVRKASKENIKKAFAELHGANKELYRKKMIEGKRRQFASLSDEEKKLLKLKHIKNYLTKEEINKRHEVILSVGEKHGFYSRAARILNMSSNAVKGFLKKYPIPKQ